MPWRYRPANHRTPKHHPLIGHLAWDQVYDHPACEHDPDFVPVEDESTPDVNPDAPSARAAGKPGKR